MDRQSLALVFVAQKVETDPQTSAVEADLGHLASLGQGKDLGLAKLANLEKNRFRLDGRVPIPVLAQEHLPLHCDLGCSGQGGAFAHGPHQLGASVDQQHVHQVAAGASSDATHLQQEIGGVGLDDGSKSPGSLPGRVWVEASMGLKEAQIGFHVLADGTASTGTMLSPALEGFPLNLYQFKPAHVQSPLPRQSHPARRCASVTALPGH